MYLLCQKKPLVFFEDKNNVFFERTGIQKSRQKPKVFELPIFVAKRKPEFKNLWFFDMHSLALLALQNPLGFEKVHAGVREAHRCKRLDIFYKVKNVSASLFDTRDSNFPKIGKKKLNKVKEYKGMFNRFIMQKRRSILKIAIL